MIKERFFLHNLSLKANILIEKKNTFFIRSKYLELIEHSFEIASRRTITNYEGWIIYVCYDARLLTKFIGFDIVSKLINFSTQVSQIEFSQKCWNWLMSSSEKLLGKKTFWIMVNRIDFVQRLTKYLQQLFEPYLRNRIA